MKRISKLYTNKIQYGWNVRFHKNGKCVLQKSFKKSDYLGSLHAALIEAKRWRNAQERIFLGKHIFCRKKFLKGYKKSKKIGTHYTEFVCHRKNRNLEFVRDWVTTWVDNGTCKTKKFSVKKYGFEKAKQLATEKRKEIEKKILKEVSENVNKKNE